MLQPGLQYSKVTTGRVCAFGKVGGVEGCGWGCGGGGDKGSDGEADETVIVLPRLFNIFPSCTHDPPSPFPSSARLEFTHPSVVLIRLG